MVYDREPVHRAPPVVAISFVRRGAVRTLRVNRAASLALLVVLPALALYYLGATAYLMFHDQLLASLISRQADMQYTYEDRIAVLTTQLDQQTGRALLDHQSLGTALRDLSSRSEQLEVRAGTIDRLLGKVGAILAAGGNASDSNGSLGPLDRTAPASPAAASSSLRLDGSSEPSGVSFDPNSHVELAPDRRTRELIDHLSAIEARQARQVARLRDPMLRAVDRLEKALTRTGLAIDLPGAGVQGDVGGPFVPLGEGARGVPFEQSVALLQDAVVRHAKLSDLVDRLPLRQPLEGQLAVTSPFGARLDPFYGRAAMHTGMDLMQPYGGPVLATAAGIVTVAGSEGGYGTMVEIDHGNGLVTRYAHLSSVDVIPHQKVAVGTIVGRVGSTGRATGPHLHYETRINGEPVDPSRFLRAGAVLAEK